jgi:hypothetical protein
MFIKRENLLNTLIRYRHKDLVKIITGVRRCGKSILLNELFYRYLIDDGVQADHIIKIAFDMKKWENLRKSDELYSYLLSQDESERYVDLQHDRFDLDRHRHASAFNLCRQSFPVRRADEFSNSRPLAERYTFNR